MNVSERLTRFLNIIPRRELLFTAVALLVVIITFQNYLLHPRLTGNPLQERTYYSNYLIFKQSYSHLVHHENLYSINPYEHLDFFKYSPTFALLMTPFALLPDFIGLMAWNFLNAWVLFAGIWNLPFNTQAKKLFCAAFVFIEAATALSNSQSNCLLAGLLLFTFLFLEKGKIELAALTLVLSVYVKIFGLLSVVLILFYPRKGKFLLYAVLWSVLLGLLPLIILTPGELMEQYQSWINLLNSDHSASDGFSLMAWLRTWFHVTVDKNILVIAGLILYSLPLMRTKLFPNNQYRLLILASTLLWVVIFNHKAESPSFVIAVTGIGIWFISQAFSLLNLCLFLLAFCFTVLSATDLFPVYFRDKILVPYVVKVFPCILIWIKLIYDLIRLPPEIPKA